MSSESSESDLPRPLSDALRTAYTHQTQIPGNIDQRILAAAQTRFDHRRRLRMTIRWSTVAATLAAAIALAVILTRPNPPAAKPIAKGDVNTDGQVNMVDALALAKHLQSNNKPDPTWDLNRDGQVNQSDVDTLATAAVSLNQTGVAQRSLPRFNELNLPSVGFASANGIVNTPQPVPFAKANPTNTREDHP